MPPSKNEGHQLKLIIIKTKYQPRFKILQRQPVPSVLRQKRSFRKRSAIAGGGKRDPFHIIPPKKTAQIASQQSYSANL